MVSSIGGFNPAAFAATSGLARNKAVGSADDSALAPPSAPSAKDTFLAYMKESPAQRMEDNWLKAHGLDEKKLAAMTPDQRAAVMKQMQTEIADALKTQTEKKAQNVDITV